MSDKIILFYHPIHARCGSLVYMMEAKGVAYEHEKDKSKFPATAFGDAKGINIAPPILNDGGKLISQSRACTMYLGMKLGFDKDVDVPLSVQYMADIADWCEGGIGKNNEDPAMLKKYMEGGRYDAFAGCIERNIKGPYFFGDEPSYVDFYLLQNLDWRKDFFEKLQAKTGKDFLAAYPKMKAIAESLRALPWYQNFDGGFKYPGMSQAIIDAYEV